MIRWCAYCQNFIGESEPFTDYSLTNGICADCTVKMKNKDFQGLEAARKLAEYYQELKLASVEGETGKIEKIVEKGLLLGIKPENIAIGMIRPILYRIGNLWSTGEATVAEEHKITANCSLMLEILFKKSENKIVPAGRTKVLLVPADGNYHILGLRVIEIFLRVSGIKAEVITPGLPAAEIQKIAAELKPEYIGISVSLSSQFASVRDLALRLKKWPQATRPKLIIGGNAVRMGLTILPEWDIEVMSDFRDLIERIKTPA